MNGSISDLLNDDEDDILAKIQEESLRFYNEVELPRLKLENQLADIVIEEEDLVKLNEKNKPSSSRNNFKEETIFYEGDEAYGFHLAAGATYIYPTNYPIRQYQANITRTALFKNTLVSLPTGLGKTFIAAVVMYNFYRWYPKGKVVFMAPTRPLVSQQIKACHHIMNIPVSDTTEMTGMINTEQRRTLWMEKRVFYLTPQVMVNDLKSGLCKAEHIKCIVFDEAHRAVKDYAYCQVVKLMAAAGGHYRTLALSATPGSDINAVQQVIKNLNITVLEIRGEDSMDVSPYTHSRSVENIVVELSPNIQRVKDDFLQIYEKYARRLKDHKAFSNNIAFLSKFQVLKACEKFRSNPPRGISSTLLGSLICDFTVCMSMAHSLELLQSYGLRAFYSYLTNESGEKCKAATNRLKSDEDLQKMLTNLGEILFPKPGSHIPYTWGHPKLQKLVAVITEHFKNSGEKNEETKVIVFCQYRIVVNEIVDILRKCSKIKPAIFVGQSGGKEKGMPQAKQVQIMKDFREGRLNCLVATCVAEEGLDIGEVDLILLMETQKSPVRLVQRLGRTGRKRKGRCVVLLTKGKEIEKFHAAMAARKAYVNNIVKSDVIKASLRQYSPSMIPTNLVPKQQLVHINVTELVSPTKLIKPNRQVDIRKCFQPQQSPFLTAEQLNEIKAVNGNLELNLDRLPKRIETWHRVFDKKMTLEELLDKNISSLSHWNEWNLEKQTTHFVSHSKETDMLCHLLQLSRNTKKLGDLYQECKNAVSVTSSGYPITKTSDDKEKDNLVQALEMDSDKMKMNKNKKCKKENLKNNTGKMLDIRTCMAAAVGKSKLPKPIEFIDLIEDSESPPPIVPSSPTTFSEKTSGSLDFLYEMDWLFELDKEQLNMIKANQDNIFRCALGRNEVILQRLNKYMIYNQKPTNFQSNIQSSILTMDLPNLEELYCSFVESFKENNIPGIKDLEKSQEENNKSPVKQTSTEKNTENYDIPSLGSDEFASIDDLFNNDGNDVEIGEKLEDKNGKNQTEEIIHSPIKSTPNKSTNLIESNFWESTPTALKYINLNNFEASKLVSSTPLLSKPSSSKMNKKDLSPVNFSPEKLHKEPTDVEEGVWNLSDLFEESDGEENVEIPGTTPGTSTMIGITQMVNEIENLKKNKLENQTHDVKHQMIDNFESERQQFFNFYIPEDFVLEYMKTEMQNKTGISSNEKFDDSPARAGKSQPLLKEKQNEHHFKENVENTSFSSSLDFKNPSLKPNFQLLKQVNKDNFATKDEIYKKEINLSSNDTHISDFDFTTHKTQPRNNSKPNFKIFKRKLNHRLSQMNESQSDFPKKTGENENSGVCGKEEIVTSCDKIKNYSPESSDVSSFTSSCILNKNSINVSKKVEISPILKTKTNVRNFKVEKQINHVTFLDSEEEDLFEKTSIKCKQRAQDFRFNSKSPSPRKRISRRPKNSLRNGLIENEAEVSGEFSGDESGNSSLDKMDESFINDESHYQVANDMHVEYLRSIKSPKGGTGKYKIPLEKLRDNMAGIYSQQVEQDTEYVNDSFCVSSSGEEIEESEISQLELAERMLNMEKRNRRNVKRKAAKKTALDKRKRRRIISPEKSALKNVTESSRELDEVEEKYDSRSKTRKNKRILLSDSDADSPIK